MDKDYFTPFDDLVDELWGKEGTPKRDAMEAEVKKELDAYHLGEAIKAERERKEMTQEQLGELVGVKRSQICRLEKGHSSMSLPTISRIFKALGHTSAALVLDGGVRVVLW